MGKKVVRKERSIEELLLQARAIWENMTDEQREAMLKKQRENYVQAELQWAKDFREGKTERD